MGGDMTTDNEHHPLEHTYTLLKLNIDPPTFVPLHSMYFAFEYSTTHFPPLLFVVVDMTRYLKHFKIEGNFNKQVQF